MVLGGNPILVVKYSGDLDCCLSFIDIKKAFHTTFLFYLANANATANATRCCCDMGVSSRLTRSQMSLVTFHNRVSVCILRESNGVFSPVQDNRWTSSNNAHTLGPEDSRYSE